jgi:hypothetical protein
VAESKVLPNDCAASGTGIEVDDVRRPVWLEATESFYKKLNRIAKDCKLTRYQALSKGLDALMRETEIRNSALNQKIKSASQSEVFRRTMGQVSRNYWATVSQEERRERGRRNAQARWGRRRSFETESQQHLDTTINSSSTKSNAP